MACECCQLSFTYDIKHWICYTHSFIIGTLVQTSSHISGPKFCNSTDDPINYNYANEYICRRNKDQISCKFKMITYIFIFSNLLDIIIDFKIIHFSKKSHD